VVCCGVGAFNNKLVNEKTSIKKPPMSMLLKNIF
jgi:hypothetical protein